MAISPKCEFKLLKK